MTFESLGQSPSVPPLEAGRYSGVLLYSIP